MSIYIISRHQTTIDWITNHLAQQPEVCNHLDEELYQRLQPEDRVIGNLPLNWIARLNDRNIEFWSINVDYATHPQWRGKDLTQAEFLCLNPTLERYYVYTTNEKLIHTKEIPSKEAQ